jgi:signal transduction histidine kinase
MRRLRLYHLIFGVALVCMAALVVWWAVFLNQAVNTERRAAVADLQHQAIESALLLGHRQVLPTAADLPEGRGVELVPCDEELRPGAAAVLPLHPEVCIQPATAAVQAIEDKLFRRRAMVHGEGLFLFLLVIVCTVMLFQLVRSERRHIGRMEAFLHAVTHEMKTPLTGIKTLLETMRSGGVPPEVQPRLLELGLENAERLEHCIENMLVAGALRAGQQQLHIVATALGPELEAVLEHRLRTLTGRPEAVELSMAPGVGAAAVAVDPDMLRIVLENLVDNGLKYGGEQPVVRLAATVEGERVSIAVSDDGIGFDRHTAAHLFVPFRRGLPEGHGVNHGTGLGLAIARDLCRRMGGDLVAHSDGPGQGATFTVSLPMAAEESEA